MTKYLAVHLTSNIQVNCLVPGGISADQPEKMKKTYSKHTPMKRMMKCSELNGILDLLCSKQFSYVTGSSIIIDGGFTAW